MMGFGQDVRFGLRQMRKAPGFTGMAVLTLALGIGAATAVFSLVDTVLLRPLAFPEAERIVALDTLSQPRGGSGAAEVPSDTSYPNFADWRAQAKSFQAMASWQGGSFTLEAKGEPARRVDGMVVAADFFRVLGVRPVVGRDFLRSEEAAGTRSVVLSHALAEAAFAGSAGAVGRTIRFSDEVYTVIGVMPASFRFPNSPDAQMWVTPAMTLEGKNPSGQQRGWNQLNVVGRLAAGVSLAQARAEMQTIQRGLAARYVEDDGIETAVSVKPELEDLVGDVRGPLRILFGAVALLLLIACANVAGLLLTRMAGRRAELALRAAMGASRVQIVRQLLVESMTLSVLGGLGGFGLAAVALRVAPRVLPSDLPRLNELALNPRVLGFSVAASVATGLLFGVLPAWRSSKLDPALALRDAGRSTTAGRSQHRLQSALVIAETALGLVLLVAAGLLIRSFDRLMSVDPGFNAQHLIAFRVGMPPKRFQDERLLRISEQIKARMAALPGVQQATYGFPLPLAGGDMNITFSIVGRPNAPGKDPGARVSLVPENFFAALQLPLRRGRLFSSADEQAKSAGVVIVNQAFADRFFAGEDPLGKRLVSGFATEETPSAEIVGVVGNVNRGSLRETPQPEYYLPYGQVPGAPPYFALRVAGDPVNYVDAVRAAAAEVDATLPVYAVRTNLLTRSTAQQRFQTELITGFAAMALLLAAIGLYGVLSYMVTQRRFELGLRMALGAQRGDVLGMIVRRGLVLCCAGLAVGLVASVGLSRFLAALLFKTPALDVATFAATTMLLLGICMAACLVPAWRASRLDPNDTLREQ